MLVVQSKKEKKYKSRKAELLSNICCVIYVLYSRTFYWRITTTFSKQHMNYWTIVIIYSALLCPYSASPEPSTKRASEVSVGCSSSLPVSNQRRAHAPPHTHAHPHTHTERHRHTGTGRREEEKHGRDSHKDGKDPAEYKQTCRPGGERDWQMNHRLLNDWVLRSTGDQMIGRIGVFIKTFSKGNTDMT